jgi:hypothetical protein
MIFTIINLIMGVVIFVMFWCSVGGLIPIMVTTLGITWHKINMHHFYFILFYHDTWWDQPPARYGIIVKNK